MITTLDAARELLLLDARNQEENEQETALPSNCGYFHSEDEEESHHPILDAYFEEGGNESLLKLTNFNLAEVQKLYGTISSQ